MTRVLEPRRLLDLEGAVNVRDLGGYATADGRSVRWKTILRADNVGGLPPESQAALIDYGVRAVIDLRRDSQIENLGNVFAESPWVTFYHQQMVSDDTPEEMAASSEIAESWIQRMGNLEGSPLRAANYCMRLDTRQEVIRGTLSTLAAPGTLPALFHCQAGKDRAGIMAALVLGIAGVPYETIAEDYELSGHYRWRASLTEREINEPYEEAPPEAFDADAYEMFRQGSPAETMVEVLEYLDDRYGGIEGYVRDAGVTEDEITALRAAIVE